MAGLLWVAAGSQFLGLIVWYRGMAAIGIPKASQLQLAQPLLTLVWSVLLLNEHLTVAAPADGRGRARVHRRHPAGTRLRGGPDARNRGRPACPARQGGRPARQVGEIVEVLGPKGDPPYRVRFEDGHEGVCSPGPDTEIRHKATRQH
ncbi:hypothetical protein GCM10023238_33430 [Streptomyces heliomycini]